MNIKVLFNRIIKVYSRVRIDVDTLEIKAQLSGVNPDDEITKIAKLCINSTRFSLFISECLLIKTLLL